MDDNDDVVGGPLQNISQDAVQEFQVATNRFSAELGRSAGSVINVVTKSGGETVHGSAAIYLRDQRWQALPADDRPRRGRRSAVRSAAGVLHARRAAAPRQRCSRSARWSHGTRTAACWSARGTWRRRRSAARSRRRRSTICSARSASTGAPRPSDDVTVRYSGQREDDVASQRARSAIGTASQRQQSRNRLHARARIVDAACCRRARSTSSASASATSTTPSRRCRRASS